MVQGLHLRGRALDEHGEEGGAEAIEVHGLRRRPRVPFERRTGQPSKQSEAAQGWRAGVAGPGAPVCRACQLLVLSTSAGSCFRTKKEGKRGIAPAPASIQTRPPHTISNKKTVPLSHLEINPLTYLPVEGLGRRVHVEDGLVVAFGLARVI